VRVYRRHTHKVLQEEKEKEKEIFGFSEIFTKQHPWGTNTLLKSTRSL